VEKNIIICYTIEGKVKKREVFNLEKKISKNISNVVNDFINKVEELLKQRLKKVILYGSYARGDYNSSSDIDIMILTDFNDAEIEEYRDKISDIAFDIELSTGYIISPVIRNIEIFNKRTSYIPFYHNIKKEGVVLIGQ